jgi:hypothetical protein
VLLKVAREYLPKGYFDKPLKVEAYAYLTGAELEYLSKRF